MLAALSPGERSLDQGGALSLPRAPRVLSAAQKHPRVAIPDSPRPNRLENQTTRDLLTRGTITSSLVSPSGRSLSAPCFQRVCFALLMLGCFLLPAWKHPWTPSHPLHGALVHAYAWTPRPSPAGDGSSQPRPSRHPCSSQSAFGAVETQESQAVPASTAARPLPARGGVSGWGIAVAASMGLGEVIGYEFHTNLPACNLKVEEPSASLHRRVFWCCSDSLIASGPSTSRAIHCPSPVSRSSPTARAITTATLPPHPPAPPLPSSGRPGCSSKAGRKEATARHAEEHRDLVPQAILEKQRPNNGACAVAPFADRRDLDALLHANPDFSLPSPGFPTRRPQGTFAFPARSSRCSRQQPSGAGIVSATRLFSTNRHLP